MAFSTNDSLKVKVLEQTQVAPPPGSVPTTCLPLTFFDAVWLVFPPVKRLYFFQFHHSKLHFTQTVLPNLKHSLSLALQHFFPFAGNLRRPGDLQSTDSEIFYADGDSISLTVAESDSNFDRLAGHQPRKAREFDLLVPDLVSKSEFISPLMALQVTVSSNSGICIGVTVSHVVADGRISTQFIKYWASICRFGSGDDDQTNPLVSDSLPFYDRTVIKDPKGIYRIYMNQLKEFQTSWDTFRVANSLLVQVPLDKFRGTFVLGRPDIERLKQWIIRKMNEKRSTTSPVSFHLSSFVVVCAFVWVCLIKSTRSDEVIHDDNVAVSKETGKEQFLFAVDCRDRLDPPVPKLYFGNCLLAYVTEAKQLSEFIGEDGIVVAVEMIGTGVQIMNSEKVMDIAETFVSQVTAVLLSGAKCVSVAGSPKFKVYETDFGWGRPKKVEVASIEDSGAMSLCESRDEEGGIEVGLVLSKLEMDAFASVFTDTLNALV